jgi:hypothetical protein
MLVAKPHKTYFSLKHVKNEEQNIESIQSLRKSIEFSDW